MQWTTLHFSRSEVDAAGRCLAENGHDLSAAEEALVIVNDWRAAHGFALNTFQMGLRSRARSVHEHALVAQRLKRVSSIIAKLRRFSKMNLSRMQDIGGCRAVMETVRQVRRVREAYSRSRQQHEFVNEKDYISDPKASGYRGIHLVYRYRSDRSTEHDGRLVEIQLRSRLQHAWATAVETVGTFLDQSLKSSEGAEKWLEFFSLTSSAFARAEGTPIITGTPEDPQELKRAIKELGRTLEVRKKLEAYSQALKVAEDVKMKSADYFLLSFMPSPAQLSVYGYKRELLEQATNHYLELEKSQLNVIGAQAVLVSVDSLSALKRAYPNYFLDTAVFMTQLSKLLE